MNAKRLTARQVAKARADIDAKIEGLRAIEQGFHVFADGENAIPESIYDAWNATLSAISEMEEHRRQVELNPRPIIAGEMGTYELAQANID